MLLNVLKDNLISITLIWYCLIIFFFLWFNAGFFSNLNLNNCRETLPSSDLLPGVTGGMGGHSAWLQVGILLTTILINLDCEGPQLPPDSRGWRGRGEGAQAEVWCESVHPRGDHGEDCGQQVAGNDGDHYDGDVDDDVCCQVHAKHEESNGGKSVYREYNREFLLPQGTNPELIKSSLSKVLVISL